jgi:hypothetical protein
VISRNKENGNQVAANRDKEKGIVGNRKQEQPKDAVLKQQCQQRAH